VRTFLYFSLEKLLLQNCPEVGDEALGSMSCFFETSCISKMLRK